MIPITEQIVLGIVTSTDNCVLIIKRIKSEKNSRAKLVWAFPGGKVNKKDKSLSDAVKREVQEETGLEVKVKRLISERDHPQFPVHISYFACMSLKDDALYPQADEVKELKWVLPTELADYFTSDLDPNVKKYLKL